MKEINTPIFIGGTKLKINDHILIKQLQRKNKDALEFVVYTYGGLLKAIISRILYEYPEDAEECLYDTMMKIWENIDGFSGNMHFKGWIAIIAKHTALNRLKQLKRIEPMVDINEVPISDTSGLTGYALFDDVFSELLSCLNDADKALFIRIFWNGESIKEASRKLGISRDNAYNRISRGKKRIIQHNPQLLIGGKKHER